MNTDIRNTIAAVAMLSSSLAPASAQAQSELKPEIGFIEIDKDMGQLRLGQPGIFQYVLYELRHPCGSAFYFMKIGGKHLPIAALLQSITQ